MVFYPFTTFINVRKNIVFSPTTYISIYIIFFILYFFYKITICGQYTMGSMYIASGVDNGQFLILNGVKSSALIQLYTPTREYCIGFYKVK